MLSSFHNPDILTCLANLSSDEVFTPPNIANQMLDLLPDELWSDKTITFLDPVSKSGVFLREITKRLLKGLESEIPDIEERLEHILKNQVFGIGITPLTSEISRRTLYCSKKANGEYSIVNFSNEEGNLRYVESQHFWANGIKCKYCGVNKKLYQREKGLESYAYSFIHEDKPEELFKMKFDVIIGNPPYQMNDGGAGASAGPIYDQFIKSAKRLQPRFMSFIIPARWYNGGKGLDDFRDEMLSDLRISKLHDYQDTNDVFPGLNIRGGICFFLWERDHNGACEVINYRFSKANKVAKRFLKEEGLNIFIRHNESLSIYKKVLALKEHSFSSIVSPRKPFGLATNFKEFSLSKTKEQDIKLYRFRENGYLSSAAIEKYKKLINCNKVLVPYASPGDDSYPHLILSKPIIAEPNSACTETYLMIGPFDNEKQSKNVSNYMKTSFFRFMVLLSKSTQHITRKTYNLVPMQNFDEDWTDEKLYQKYKVGSKEIEFIDSLIKKFS
jgi:site-specific DNA-methyltransferase (adenine-specific)